uniref:Uncharacterized protein n=1 Tax=Rhizophora mucronata TaxID=61149 RepID=A0A2P2Q9U9_RHIMU
MKLNIKFQNNTFQQVRLFKGQNSCFLTLQILFQIYQLRKFSSPF